MGQTDRKTERQQSYKHTFENEIEERDGRGFQLRQTERQKNRKTDRKTAMIRAVDTFENESEERDGWGFHLRDEDAIRTMISRRIHQMLEVRIHLFVLRRQALGFYKQ